MAFKTVRNWREFLFSVKDLSNVELIKLMKKEGFEQLSKKEHMLTSRSVFALNATKVIKIARNQSGVFQNNSEQNIYLSIRSYDRKHFAKLYVDDCSRWGEYVIMERVKQVRANTNLSINALKWGSPFREAHERIARAMNEPYHEDLAINHNIGFIGTRPVALDYGFDHMTRKAYMSARSDRNPASAIRQYFGLVEV